MDVSPEAADVLRRSLQLAGSAPRTGVRLRRARGLAGGFDVQVEFAESPAEGEEEFEAEGIRFFVDPEVARMVPRPVVTVEPQHETVVVRPGGAD